MGFFRKVVLYTALVTFANAALADTAELEALREGDMRKLVFHSEPKPVPDAEFSDLDGSIHSLTEYHGKWVLLNFWATWCAPCRLEMPTLVALQDEFGGDSFAVVTLATGRNPPPAITRFFEEAEITNLPTFIDPSKAIANPMGVMGLPVTVIINPEGQEVARLMGDAAWDSESAKAILAAMMESGK